MTKQEKKDKLIAMDELGIHVNKRSAFIKWANKWGRFNLKGDRKWYEYSPVEDRSKSTLTMKEMWDRYNLLTN